MIELSVEAVRADETCVICEAVMHPWELTEHLRWCVMISLADDVVTRLESVAATTRLPAPR